jgi:hypothetical protein
LPTFTGIDSLKSKQPISFLIYAPPYDELSGGAIVLHKLCFLLNSMGYKSSIWPYFHNDSLTKRLKRMIGLRRRGKKNSYRLSSHYPNNLAKNSDLNKSTVVIYPEVIAGNPLNHDKIIRWFLHKPGFHTGTIDFGDNELYFFFDQHSNDSDINSNNDNKLSVVSVNPEYKDLELSGRNGSCYIMRKGHDRSTVHNLNNSIKIDGKSHKEIAQIFNQSEFFYSYDEMTMYSQFAALCGCTSIIIPENYNCRQDWVNNHPIGKYGVAYGEEDIEHARSTQHKLRNYFDELEEKSKEEVIQFIQKSKYFFNLL